MKPESSSTPLLLETIRIDEGRALHLPYHNQRFNQSRKALFSIDERVDLGNLLAPPNEGPFRCRILYDKEIRTIEYIPYRPKTIKRISFAEISVDYRYKYADRSQFQALLSESPRSDDVLILRDGFLTDSTIANIALLKNGKWITPDKPLLKGTTRERLIDEGFLTAAAIRKEEISDSDGFALMNAMIGFKIINPIWL